MQPTTAHPRTSARLAALLCSTAVLGPIAFAAQTPAAADASGRSLLAVRAPKAYVSSASAGTVSVIDTATDAVVNTIVVGASPGAIALAHDGARAYVPNAASDTLSVIDTQTETVLATIPVGDAPGVAAVTPDGARVYVGGANGIVTVVDSVALASIGSIVVGAPSTGTVAGIAVAPDGARVYALWGNLVVIDTATNTVTHSIYAGNTTTGLAVSPDGARIYVSDAFGYGEFSFSGTLAVVDAASVTVSSVIGLYSLPTSIAIAPDGAQAFVSTPSVFVNTGYGAAYINSPWVQRIDLATHTLTGGVSVANPARGLAFTPDGEHVYVATAGNAVRVVDAGANVVVGTIPVGGSPVGVAIRR